EDTVYDRVCAPRGDCYTDVCCLCTVADLTGRSARSCRLRNNVKRKQRPWVSPRPDSSVVERGPEKAGVGGSIPSLATTPWIRHFSIRKLLMQSSAALLLLASATFL